MSVSGYRLTPDHENNCLQLCDGEVVLSAPKSNQKLKNKKTKYAKQKEKNRKREEGEEVLPTKRTLFGEKKTQNSNNLT